MAKSNSRARLAALMLIFLAACAGPPPRPVPETGQAPASPQAQEPGEEVQQRVREPARQGSAGIQVFPLQNPAVRELKAQADKAEADGDYNAASVVLERALRIEPRDPEILQSMAEIQLHKKDYEQALGFAVRSYDFGSRVGEICSRNWHTISVAREHLGEEHEASEARLRAGQCMNSKPPSY